MPWAIVETRSARGAAELLEVPDTWIEGDYLWCPAGSSLRILQKIENSTRKSNWSKIRCTVKRKNIATFLAATNLIEEMSGMSSSDASVSTKKSKRVPVTVKKTFVTNDPPTQRASSSASSSIFDASPPSSRNFEPPSPPTGNFYKNMPVPQYAENSPTGGAHRKVTESGVMCSILKKVESNAKMLDLCVDLIKNLEIRVAEQAAQLSFIMNTMTDKSGSCTTAIEPPMKFSPVANQCDMDELELKLSEEEFHAKFVSFFLNM